VSTLITLPRGQTPCLCCADPTAYDRTDATTTQLYDPHAGEWNRDLFVALGLPIDIMPDLEEPGAGLGTLSDSVQRATGPSVDTLHIVGGGAQNRLLCQLTADAAGVPVVAEPVEATVSGALLVQALALGVLDSPQAIRNVVRASFDVTTYPPAPTLDWDARFAQYLDMMDE